MGRWLLLGLLLATTLCRADLQTAAPQLLALCYHDVVTSAAAAAEDPMAVTVDTLVQHFAWLDAEGYETITLDQWAAAATGAPLPDKPVLLTFDDGYASFHRHVLPLLELFDYSAVVAPVTTWVDAPPGSRVDYGEEQVGRDRFMTWAELRDAAASGRVEIATHSHDLHRGIPGNPFGNLQPAAATRRWDGEHGRYEDDAAYRQRVAADLRRSVALIERHVGVRPRAVVWPYGAYTAEATAAARALGLDYGLTLDTAPNSPRQRNVHRLLIDADRPLPEFVLAVRGLYSPRPLRAAHVDLDYVYDDDPAQQGRNLDRLLDRIKAMRISHVFLQAFADPDGNGAADAVYFPNRHLPVRADLFNRVAWQLATRADVTVYAWMPVLAFELPDPERRRALAVRAADGSENRQPFRLSPFHPQVRRMVSEIYGDLGRSSHFAGVLFHDDALLGDREDVSPAALAFYRRHWGMTVTPDPAGGPLRVEGATPAEWARAKTRHLIDFTEELADELRRHRPSLRTARNLYARVVTEPESEQWFAQNLRLFLDRYDYTALMAMPYLEGVRDPEAWLAELVSRVAARPAGLARTIFEVQTVDWRQRRPLAPATLARHLDVLMDAGARHLAWYPEDFVADHPPLELIRSRLSLADHPALLE
jgi:biofilm PGA synthesis lipoprotein PgaB